MSNNIYDILKKMAGLDSPKSALTESKKVKPDYIDIDKDGNKTEPLKKAAKEKRKGAVAEAVAQVEKQLNEKYMGFKKAADKKLGEGDRGGPDDFVTQGLKKTNDAMSHVMRNYVGPAMEPARKAFVRGIDDVVSTIPGGKEELARKRERDPNYDKGEGWASYKDKDTTTNKSTPDKMKEGNKFSGNLAKARAQGLKRADLDDDGDMEPVREDLPVRFSPEELNTRQQSADIEKKLANRKAGDQLKQTADKQPEKKHSGTMKEGWDEMQKYLEKKRGPEPKGEAGKKAGTRYGGSAQRDDSEDVDGEGQPTVKKKGRPKGTGGGAKFNFKLPKNK